jgi:hypothetical protein
VVDVHAGQTLTGRNEVRIGAGGRVDLSGGTLASNRWVNIRAGGELRGQGHVTGDVYNEGVIGPGRPVQQTSWPITTPPALPSKSLDAGVVTAAAFNFAGVQDDVPLQAATVLSPYIEIAKGLDFGPGISPKLGNGATDGGDEFNIMGQTGASLDAAIVAGDYISFSVDPVDGVGAIPSSVSFSLWRNGGAAAKNFAILSSVDGFSPDAALAQAAYNGSDTLLHTLTASLPSVESITEPIEYRLYGWGATDGGGNTHVNAASMTARFVGVPTLAFDFASVSNGSPLTALKLTDSRLQLLGGLSPGLGLAQQGAGGQLSVAGFAAASLQAAIDNDDYLSFAVQAIDGLALIPDSVSFTLSRDAAGSAPDYAVFSSVDGFAAGQQLAQIHNTTTGSSNRFEMSGDFPSAQPTADPVEFRLYGWNAVTPLAATHVVGASMRASFASVVGSQVDPTGRLTIQGDYFHLAGSTLAIDLGGTAAANLDALQVLGEVELNGDLLVSLVDTGQFPFSPGRGDSFEIITAAEGLSGNFTNVSLPALDAGLDWFLDYSANSVTLQVVASADFNSDGSVDHDDLLAWKSGFGRTSADRTDGDADSDNDVDGQDFLQWQRQLGAHGLGLVSATRIPEPTESALLWPAGMLLLGIRLKKDKVTLPLELLLKTPHA